MKMKLRLKKAIFMLIIKMTNPYHKSNKNSIIQMKKTSVKVKVEARRKIVIINYKYKLVLIIYTAQLRKKVLIID